MADPDRAAAMEAEHSYDDAVELAGHGRYNRAALAASCVVSVASALDMFGLGAVLAAAACDLRLRLAQLGLLASAPFAGVLFALPWGYYADTRGRRRALLAACTGGFVLAALASLAPSWQILLLLKLAGCCFSTAAYGLTAAYLGECTGARRRGRYLFIMSGVNLSSEAITFILAYFILPLTFNAPIPWLSISYRPWRLLTLLMATPLGAGAMMMWFLYESPKFLANIGETEKALEVLKKIYEVNGGKKENYQVKDLRTNLIRNLDSEIQYKQSCWESIRKQTVPIFKPPLLWRTLQLFYLLVICCSTNNVFVMWFPTMVNSFFAFMSLEAEGAAQSFCARVVDNMTAVYTERGDFVCNDTISDNTIYSGIIYGLFFTGVSLAAAALAARRRALLLGALAAAGGCAALVPLPAPPLAGLLLFALLQGTSVGIGAVTSYFVDLYPTSYRGLAASLGMMAARLGSCAGVNAVGAALVGSCHLTFYFWAAFVLSKPPIDS